MILRIEQGKGRKDRYAMLSPVMLERLRVWWRVTRAQGKMPDGGWLFPGMNPVEPLTTRQLNRVVHAAPAAANIDKRISMHTLRHSFATDLLEQKVDIRVIHTQGFVYLAAVMDWYSRWLDNVLIARLWRTVK